jgi:hypothetical protein
MAKLLCELCATFCERGVVVGQNFPIQLKTREPIRDWIVAKYSI